MKAAPYTNGLKVEPGWRRAACTWSNGSTRKVAAARRPTWPVTGSMRQAPPVFSAPVMMAASSAGLRQRVIDGSPLSTACGIQGFAHQGLAPVRFWGSSHLRGRPGVVGGNALQLAGLPYHGLVGHGLQARVDGGAHDEAIGIQAAACCGIGPGDELFAQLDAQVRPGPWLRSGVQSQCAAGVLQGRTAWTLPACRA